MAWQLWFFYLQYLVVSDHLIMKRGCNKYIYDFGNNAIGEEHSFTGMASFIECVHTPPDAVFIVNQENGVIPRARQNMPLNNKLSLQWGPVYLALGVSYQFVLSIGIANGEKMAKYQKSHQFFSIFLHFHFESR